VSALAVAARHTRTAKTIKPRILKNGCTNASPPLSREFECLDSNVIGTPRSGHHFISVLALKTQIQTDHLSVAL
jgi:hypothetical protein